MSPGDLAHPRRGKGLEPRITDRESIVEIRTPGSQPSMRGPPELFTGTAWIDYLHQPVAPARAQVQHVMFEPGARTAWHTHPLGQTLVVTTGVGWIQSEGGEVQEVRPGDVISIRPGERHWHGATASHRMAFLAVQEELDGRVVDSMEHVSDEQYRPPSATVATRASPRQA